MADDLDVEDLLEAPFKKEERVSLTWQYSTFPAAGGRGGD